MEPQPKILILGGTNFMGKALLDELSLTHKGSLICCINRGKTYWNNQARKHHPHILNFYSDRKDHTDTTAAIRFVSNHLEICQSNKWSAVVDFCGFKWRDVQSVAKALKGLTERYIFISTDSVYNNCQSLTTPVREQQIDLQTQYRCIKSSNRSKDSYGYNKMKCEMYLQRTKPFPFVCLRLPDVIGPYDNTQRFWCTLKWIGESQKLPLPLTADEQNVKLSFVDSLSVANFIAKLIDITHIPSNVYNLCHYQTPTLQQFLKLVAHTAGKKIVFKAETNKSSNNFYPSVECGRISCDRAVRQLGWKPLSLSEAVQKTVEFFMNKAEGFSQQKKQMQKEYRRKVVKND